MLGFVAFAEKNKRSFFSGHLKQKILGKVSALAALIQKYEIQEVLIAVPTAEHKYLIRLIDICSEHEVAIKIIPDVFHLITGPVYIDDIQGLPFFGLKEEPLESTVNRFLKRSVDSVVSGIGLVVLAPILLFVALLIKLESKGPIFFKQERVGRDHHVFMMYKFRSMVASAEKHSGPVWAIKEDSRRTRLGGFLRRTSIDELPQLLNVLKGDMSLVGPRPERPYFVDQFKNKIPRYLERHKVKAGITGWAQVHGLRGNTSLEERIKHDLYYIENWSLLLDITILLQTVLDVFEHEHAY